MITILVALGVFAFGVGSYPSGSSAAQTPAPSYVHHILSSTSPLLTSPLAMDEQSVPVPRSRTHATSSQNAHHRDDLRVQRWRFAQVLAVAATEQARWAALAAQSAPGSPTLVRTRLRSVTAEVGFPARGARVRPKNPIIATGRELSIKGRSTLSASQIEGWYVAQGDRNNSGVPLSRLLHAYFVFGRTSGVRPDVAFAQSIVETGGLSVVVGDNFAGIGNCDSCRGGQVFADYQAGVHAQLALLGYYAGPRFTTSAEKYSEHVVGEVHVGGYIAGRDTTWSQLSHSWSTGPTYGLHVLSVYRSMLVWALAHPAPRPRDNDSLLSRAKGNSRKGLLRTRTRMHHHSP